MTYEPTTRQRCDRIARLLRGGQGSSSENLIDLLADAMHWCRANALDFEELLRIAEGHYQTEIVEQIGVLP